MRFAFALSSTLIVACSLLTNLSDLGGSDAGSDALPDVAPNDFALFLAPSVAALNPGDPPITITIDVVRGSSFTGTIDFMVTGAPVGIMPTTPTPAIASQTTSSFGLGIAGALKGQYAIVVTGTSGSLAKQATLPLYVDTTLAPDDAGVVIVPSWAGSLDGKAWGAGGGGGGQGGVTKGAQGGGGGFASGTFAAAAGSKWTLVSGTGGQSCTGDCGGGGGGFSGLMDPSGNWVLIAGGGGGGGAFDSSGGGSGIGGGGGGGKTGQNALFSSCPATGGTQSKGGSGGCVMVVNVLKYGGDGGAFEGGAAGPPELANFGGGGYPGGGSTSSAGSCGAHGGGGGGGGGFFGGGGGVFSCTTPGYGSGGGGGSGFVDPKGSNGVNDAADASVCAHASDPDLTSPCNGGDAGASGAAGWVIVRAKP